MTKKEGRKILKRLKFSGIKIADIAKKFDVTRAMVYGVLGNTCKSKHIEDYLRKIGGMNES